MGLSDEDVDEEEEARQRLVGEITRLQTDNPAAARGSGGKSRGVCRWWRE